MTIEAQVCPQCGSAVHFKKGQAEIVCDSCGTTVVKTSAPRAASLVKEVAEEKLLKEITDRETRLFRDGRQATAKILTAQTTNIIRNNLDGKGVLMSFTVEVLPKDEAPFNTETKAMVGLIAIEKYQPGTVLDVSYDPLDHTQVSVEGRHGLTNSYWQQLRKDDEQIREADEMLRQADEEYQQGEEEYRKGEEEEKQADEKLQKLTRQRKK